MVSLPQNSDIKIGDIVLVELKEDQGTGKLTEGIIAEKLTSAKSHPYGIMVRLEDNKIGRVKDLPGNNSDKSKDDFDELEYQKYLKEISDYRRQTTPQYEIKPIQMSTKIIPKSDVPKNEDKFIEFKETFHFDSQEKKFRESGNIKAADGLKSEKNKRERAIKKEISIAVTAFGNTMGGSCTLG